MDKVFANHIGRNLEVYVEDMVIESLSPEEHIKNLEEIFVQVRKYDMRLNLDNDIEANPDKCDIIIQMKCPQNVKEVIEVDGTTCFVVLLPTKSSQEGLTLPTTRIRIRM
ncbi:hypothetical protein CR513_37409, partial [Mucuna pruriens]